MNVVLARSKQEHSTLWWEPFATSTPLKVGSSNVKLGNGLQKQLQIPSNSFKIANDPQKIFNVFPKTSYEFKPLIAKKVRRNKSSAYFEFSSSDEESFSESKKRPIIKLSSGRETKLLLTNKKESEETDVAKLISSNRWVDRSKKTKELGKNNASTLEDSKFNHDQSFEDENKRKSNAELISNLNNICTRAAKSKIFEGTKKSKTTIKRTENKENSIKDSKSNESVKALNYNPRSKKMKLNETNKIDNKLRNSVPNIIQIVNISKKVTSDYTELHKPLKRKGKNIVSSVAPDKKTKTRKTNSKQTVGGDIKTLQTPQKICDTKANLSHQLFSDKKEQELINVLDLTSEEVLEERGSMSSLCSNYKNMPYKSSSSHPSHLNICYKESKPNKSKKKIQNSKKLQNSLIEPLPDKQTNAEENKNSKKVLNHAQKGKESKSNVEKITQKNQQKLKNLKTEKKAKKKVNLAEKESKKLSKSDNAENVVNRNKLSNSAAHLELSCLLDNQRVTRNDDSKKSYAAAGDGKVIKFEKPVFKKFDELSLKENEKGCSAAPLWTVSTFKCGVFKLKVNSQISCKTLHTNSYLGGVLVSGDIRMKIGDKELDLKQGDMAFVPPLTEWGAANIGECESVFYYWCGRFNC